jgi:hypothetical protein
MTNPFTFICGICGLRKEPCEHWEQQEVIRLLREDLKFNRMALLDIIHLLSRQFGFTIQQVHGGQAMSILGIVAGKTGVFTETPTPAGSSIPAGTIPVWTSSDTVNAPVVPTADGTGCSVTVPSSATITTFNLTVANQDGSFSTTVAVPVTPAVVPPPPPIPQTGFDIEQTS